MARRESWIKAHSEDNNTASLIRASWAARGVWYALQLHTMEHCDTPGVLTRGRKPIAIADLALELHTDEHALRAAIEELLEAGGLLERREGGVLAFPNWNKRQLGNAASNRDAWRTTKRRQRKANRNAPSHAAQPESHLGQTVEPAPLLRSLK
jgi:hypothetical protein